MIPTRNPSLRWEQLGDSVAVLNLDDGCAHSLVGLAAAIWMATDGSTDTSQLVRTVVGTAPAGTTDDDVRGALANLQHLGLIDGPALGRRQMLRIGAGVAAGAAVLTIGLPTPAMAASLQPIPPNTPGFYVEGDTTEADVIVGFQAYFPSELDDPLVEILEIRGTFANGTVDDTYPTLYFYMDDNPNLFEPPAVVQLAGPGGLIETEANGDPAYNVWNSVTSIKVDYLNETFDVLGTAYFPEAIP